MRGGVSDGSKENNGNIIFYDCFMYKSYGDNKRRNNVFEC